MTTPFYNSSYGSGIEGVMNYVNTITNTWFSNLFLLFIFTVTMYTLSKSEWKMNSALTFSFFLIFISTMIMRLFMQINPLVMYITILGLGITVFIGLWDKQK